MTGSDALIYRMIFNLTENAIKYNRPDGSVQVCITQEPEKLLILVSDTGRGIPEEYQQSIFQPFFRVDKSRSRTFGGAGLGLALVWEIAALHGGSVRVAESSDSGTTIAAELPALPAIMQQLPKTKHFRNNRMLALRAFYCHESKRTEMRGKHDR